MGVLRPVIERLPRTGLGGLGRDAFEVSLEVLVGGRGHFEIAGQQIENAGHVGGALNIGVAAQRIHAASRASDVAQQKLQNRGAADGLSAGTVLRPADRIDDGARLLHVAIFADGSEQVGRLEELVLGHAGDSFHHLRACSASNAA